MVALAVLELPRFLDRFRGGFGIHFRDLILVVNQGLVGDIVFPDLPFLDSQERGLPIGCTEILLLLLELGVSSIDLADELLVL